MKKIILTIATLLSGLSYAQVTKIDATFDSDASPFTHNMNHDVDKVTTESGTGFSRTAENSFDLPAAGEKVTIQFDITGTADFTNLDFGFVDLAFSSTPTASNGETWTSNGSAIIFNLANVTTTTTTVKVNATVPASITDSRGTFYFWNASKTQFSIDNLKIGKPSDFPEISQSYDTTFDSDASPFTHNMNHDVDKATTESNTGFSRTAENTFDLPAAGEQLTIQFDITGTADFSNLDFGFVDLAFSSTPTATNGETWTSKQGSDITFTLANVTTSTTTVNVTATVPASITDSRGTFYFWNASKTQFSIDNFKVGQPAVLSTVKTAVNLNEATIQEVYNISGTLVGNSTEDLIPGLYIVKYDNNKVTKVLVE